MKFSIFTILIMFTTSISLSSCAMQTAMVETDNLSSNTSTKKHCTQRPELCRPAKQQVSIQKKIEDKGITITEQIKDAQRILKLLHNNNRPYYSGDLSGEYNSQTRDAIIVFQKNYLINPSDGQLDSQTIDKLKTAENDMNLSSGQSVTMSSQSVKQTPKAISYTNINALTKNKLYELTAYLKELGYYSGNIADAMKMKPEIELGLMNFQKSFNKYSQLITHETWERLRLISLSKKIKAELKIAQLPQHVATNVATAQPLTTSQPTTHTPPRIKHVLPSTNITKKPPQTVTQSKSVSKPITTTVKQPSNVQRPKLVSPPLPIFQLTTKQNIFAIEEIKCKNKHAAWITFYEGKIQEIQSNKVNMQLTNRYALWYDSRKDDISYGDWWCIPRQRFCYAKVEFSDWGGKQKAGGNYTVNKNKVIPTDTKLGRDEGIAALSAKLADSQCGFKKKR